MRVPPRRFLLPAAGAVLLAAAVLLLQIVPAGRAPRPNIILISLDTLRADRLGCYGRRSPTSPRIDAFARDGVQFLQAFSQNHSTATSHMSLFTGFHPTVHRVTSWLQSPEKAAQYGLARLGPGIPTLAQYLRENGYRTVGLHHSGLVSPFFGFDRGFDVYTDKWIPWIRLHADPSPLGRIGQLLRRSARTGKPLFLFLHTYICHAPYSKAPVWIRQRFLPRPDPGLVVGPVPAGRSFWSMYKPFWNAVDPGNESHRRQVGALYDADVNYADWVVGQILSRLKAGGHYDPAIIAVVSDHGEEFWEHGMNSHHQLFRESLHVPLLLKLPGNRFAGRKVAAPVALFDLMPTLLDYLRIAPRPEPQARSLLPLLRGGEKALRRVLSFDNGLRFVRFNEGRYVYASGVRFDPGDWLFDAAADPGERRNLAGEKPLLARQMRSLAARIMEEQHRARGRVQAGAGDRRRFTPQLKKQLEALGYL